MGEVRDLWPAALKRGAAADVEVVRPRSTAEVVEAVRRAAAQGRRVTAVGAGTNVVGSLDGPLDLVVSLAELQGYELDRESQVVTVGAGTNGGELEARLNQSGLTLGHYPQSLRISTVGGWIATRATGTSSALFGGIERLVCGLEAVLASGEVLRVAPRARPAGGLDLASLLLGSEGSLAIVTEVSLAVHRVRERRVVCASFPTFADGLAAQRELVQGGYPVDLLRLYNEPETAHLVPDGVAVAGCLLVVTTQGPAQLLAAQEDALRGALAALGATPVPEAAAAPWFERRFDAEGMMESRNALPGVMFDTIEVSLPWRTAAACAAELERSLAGLSEPYFLHSSHVYGTGTCLYMILFHAAESDEAVLERNAEAWRVALDVVERHQGAIGHHHGIGAVRSERYAASAEGRAHRLVKDGLDPDGLLKARLLAGA